MWILNVLQMDAIKEKVTGAVVDLLLSSPPPAPPPPDPLSQQQYIDNVIFMGFVLCMLYFSLILVDVTDTSDWSEVPFFQLAGAGFVTLSYLLGFLHFNSIHSTVVSFAIICFAKHLAILNDLEPRLSNIIALFTIVPGIFLLAYKHQVFYLQSCDSMRMLLVVTSLIPVIMIVRTLKSVGYDREKRILRFRLIGLYVLVLMFHTIVSPQHMCQNMTNASATSTTLLFDLSILLIGYA